MSIPDIPLTETIFYILLVLVDKPRHGYGITQEVARLTDGRVQLGPGTLYGALKTLTAKQWIRLVSSGKDSRGKKEYEVTETGCAVLKSEIARLEEALKNAGLVLEDGKC